MDSVKKQEFYSVKPPVILNNEKRLCRKLSGENRIETRSLRQRVS